MNEHGMFLTLCIGKISGWGACNTKTSSMKLSVEVSALKPFHQMQALLTLECGLLKMLGGKMCIYIYTDKALVSIELEKFT